MRSALQAVQLQAPIRVFLRVPPQGHWMLRVKRGQLRQGPVYSSSSSMLGEMDQPKTSSDLREPGPGPCLIFCAGWPCSEPTDTARFRMEAARSRLIRWAGLIGIAIGCEPPDFFLPPSA